MLSSWLVALILLILAERALEVAVHRRNAKRLSARGAAWLGADGFGMILAAQVLLFTGCGVELTLAPWSGPGRWTIPAVAALALAQALRWWCIATLGDRWSIRVVTLPGAPRISRGPYRVFPHPNYAAVMLEAIALPLACGAYATLLIVAPLHLVALWRRVRIEERALRGNNVPLALADT